MADETDNKDKTNPAAPTAAAVDIDKLKVKILFICKNTKKIDPPATYLTRRGWDTLLVTDVKEAFKMISVFKPDFLLLSVNVQTPKLAQLPTVIFHTFKVPVVTFGEEGDTKTMQLMQSVPSNYKMQGVVSGPSTHRRIKQILQENLKMQGNIATANEAEEATEENNVGSTIREKRKLKAKYTFSTEEPTKKSQSEMMRFESEKKDSGPSMIITKGAIGPGAKNGGVAYNPNNPEDIEALAAEFAIDENNPPTIGEGVEGTPLGDVSVNDDLASVMLEDALESNDTRRALVLNSAEQTENAAGEKATEEHSFVAIAKKCAMPQTKPGPESVSFEDCIIWPLKYGKKKGLLIVSHRGAEEEATQFNSKYKQAIQEEGEKTGQECVFGLEVRGGIGAIDLSAEIEGEVFTVQIENGSGDTAVKFLHSRTAEPLLEYVPGNEKAKLQPAELVTEVPVGVDLYLHLPKNEKYYLYLNSIAHLSEKQKGKLVSSKADVFIKKEDVDTYKESFARNKTVEMLRNMKKQKKSA